MSSQTAGLVVGLLLGLVAGLLAPRVIAALPEPEPDPVPEPGEDESGRFERATATAKILYADLATAARLGLWLALVAGALGAVTGARLGWSEELLVALPLVPVAVVLAYIDWRTTYLPTRIIAPAYGVAVAGILIAALASDDRDDLVRAVIGWAIYGGFFFALWFVFPRGFGYGDVRLSGLLGLVLGYLGWSQLYVGIMSGVLLGGLGGVLLALVNPAYRKRFSYGPFMLAGAFLGILLGHDITDALGYGSFPD